MKKSSRILGTMAVSAALVMGTAVPAFADPATATDEANITSNNLGYSETNNTTVHSDKATGFSAAATTGTNAGASTVVTVSTYTSQISVTIPIKLPVALDTAGGKGYAPTGYKIKNNSKIDVYVQKADYKIKDDQASNWTFTDEKVLAADVPATDRVAINILPAPGTGTDEPAIGSLAMKLTPKETAVGTTPFVLKGTATDNQGKTTQLNSGKLNWKVAAAVDSTPGEAEMVIDAGSSQLKNAESYTGTVAAVTYTVSMNQMA